MDPAALIARLTHRLFGSPILLNSLRGEIVEGMVAMALEPDWEHCAGELSRAAVGSSDSGQAVGVPAELA